MQGGSPTDRKYAHSNNQRNNIELNRILVGYLAFDAGYIDESQGNTIWANMIARKRKFGYASFLDYLAEHQSE